MHFRWRVPAVVVLGALAASAFSTVLASQVVRAIGQEPQVWRLAFLNATFWFGWVLLAVPLVWLARRVRIDRRPRLAVLLHVLAIVTAAFLHVALQTSADTVDWWWSMSSARPDVLEAAGWQAYWIEIFPFALRRLIDWELIAGAAIVGIAHAYFYYNESRERAVRTAQLETRLVEAQLRMLQHQLHPHFLFNTLHAISALMHRDVRAADRMLAQLSDLLRLTLYSVAKPEIRLNEELEFIEKYIQIEQVRLGDRLTVEWQVDADVLDAAVPALVLQPLVENAIKHGVAPIAGPGRVAIGARREGDQLTMTVTDTGPGPSDHTLAELSTGIGVANTRARLTHQFGAHFRFEFRKLPDGFMVLVAIPFRQEPGAVTPAFVA
jgi:signal transduction histidine kinase